MAARAVSAHTSAGHHAPGHKLWALSIAALGVVLGDIGTSPIYALKECFDPSGSHALPATEINVLGVLSLVFWALIVTISVKYIGFIMRAHNRGEGGIFALLSMVGRLDLKRWMRGGIVLLAIGGAALLYGDGVITPSISVLSAIEGLKVVDNNLTPFVLPLTIMVLFALFAVQKSGTGKMGRVFGPVMLVWFGALATLGLLSILKQPEVLAALNPLYAIEFFSSNGWHAFVALGAVVLCITGGEALYADMGHFGLPPIRRAWFVIALPALLLNYFGQGALLLGDASAAQHPFYKMMPDVLVLPMTLLATMATIIASQALISGAFSLTNQAMQLGFMPRMRVVHTDSATEGQIYIPAINWALMLCCITVVLIFKSSTAMAGAYGLAVTGGMAVSSLLFGVVAVMLWRWNKVLVTLLVTVFLCFDLGFCAASALKFLDGGWFPVALAVLLVAVMTTWKHGRRLLVENMGQSRMPAMEDFVADVARVKPHRVRGTAVFMCSAKSGVPVSMLHHFKHNQVLHQQVVVLSVDFVDVPYVTEQERCTVKSYGDGFWRVVAQSGFMEMPRVPQLVADLASCGLVTDPSTTSYFLGRETVIIGRKGGMAAWRKRLFFFLTRNALNATSFFGIPPGRVVEMGLQVEL
ncbi:MAG: potassium transporter Kup [Planctomycetes bacterium]|nr:potassium transporter Kup [Planctomycetota bacterium]